MTMRTMIFFALMSISAFTTCAQTNTFLTNDVIIGNRNVCFAIKDYRSTNGDKEIFSERLLSWILHNPTTNYANVHWQKLEQTFSVKLFDSQRQEVPLTDYGKEMNSGPRPLPTTGSIHFIGLQPGQTEVMDFTSIDRLFRFPKPGEYIFEARYWYIEIGSHGRWKLSEPVRLKVINRAIAKASMDATNRPSH